jgi:hypothetical protein
MIAVDIKRNGTKSEFMRVRPGVFGLRALHAVAATPDLAPEELTPGEDGLAAEKSQDETEHRVRTPLFPTYAEVRHLLRIWPGRPRKQVTGLQATLADLRGTPQNTVDWTEPDQWIPERLKDAGRELAEAIWAGSGKAVNPRHTHGHGLLVQKYELVREDDGGVDVVADIELGITSVREVVQAKRHKRTIQRKDLDALRGSLYRFNAVRRTIIATAPFSKGTSEAAFATGAAPITLIDGDKLIDMLIEHDIGVKKNKIEVLSVDADAFADLEPEA